MLQQLSYPMHAGNNVKQQQQLQHLQRVATTASLETCATISRILTKADIAALSNQATTTTTISANNKTSTSGNNTDTSKTNYDNNNHKRN